MSLISKSARVLANHTLRSRTRRPMAERKYYVFMTFGRAKKRKERRPSVTN
jgi:hypothetical protein